MTKWLYRPAVVRRVVFVYEIVWFVALIALAFAYFKSATLYDWVPSILRGIPVETAWFGTLGGVAISLHGVYEHAALDKDGKTLWNDGWPLWYLGRPFSGLLAGIVTYTLLRALDPKSQPTREIVLAAAFILGTQENRFFAFLAKVGSVIVAVPSDTSNPGPPDENSTGGTSGSSS